MENQNKLTPEEVTELRKSLTDLGMKSEEVDSYIEKAMKPKESSTEETMEEKTEKAGGEEGAEKPAVKEEVEKSMADEEDLEKACSELKSKKAEIEKSIEEMELKMGKKKEPIEKAVEVDFEKSFGERFIDIEKSLTEKFEDKFDDLNDLVKGLQDELATAKEELKKIGDMPLGTKAIVSKANFFEKGVDSDINDNQEKVLSISRDRDDLIKGMTDMFNKEKDADIREMLSNGISDFTINKSPNGHGISALAYLSRKQNITLEQ